MSMLCCILALTPRQMKTLRARPGLTLALSDTHFDDAGVEITEAAEVDDKDEYAESSSETGSDDAGDEDDEFEEDEEEDYDEDDDDDEGEEEDVDLSTVFDEPVRKTLELQKSWDFLQVLLAKFEVADTKLPANSLLGGEPIGDDVGYGEANLRTAAETEQFARFLQSVDLDRLLSQVNFEELKARKLYAFPEDDAELREILAYYYPPLRDYVTKAAAAKHGLLVWLE